MCVVWTTKSHNKVQSIATVNKSGRTYARTDGRAVAFWLTTLRFGIVLREPTPIPIRDWEFADVVRSSKMGPCED